MPVRAQLKHLWETTVPSCFGGQTARKGDELTSSPVATSQVSPRGTGPSKTSKVFAIYPFLPIFLLILLLIQLCAPHASAHTFRPGDLGFTDHVLEHDTSAGDTGTRAAPAVKVEASSKNQPRDDDDQDNDGHQGSDENQGSGGNGAVTRLNGAWVVPGVGPFKKRAVYTFEQDTLPAGLTVSNYTVQCRTKSRRQPSGIPYNECFDPANVRLSNGFLNLIVPGGQQPTKDHNFAISCAEVTTVEQNILYASVRTTAIFSQEPGTCHGIFFYKNDTQETDIEYLTDPSSLSNFGPDKPIPMWYTNQAVDPENADKTSQTGTAPTDCTTNIHEYRIDWTRKRTAFYLDGVLQRTFKDNIPSCPGPWVWNNWANGDKGWSVGPPASDNILRIKNITMYYNTANGGSGAPSSMQKAQETE